MKYLKVLILLVLFFLAYTGYDFITLTDKWRFFGWEMFTKSASDVFPRSFTIGPEKGSVRSGQGIFPESPYVFTKGWFLLHVTDWEKHFNALKGKPNIHALEIGSYEGFSAIWQIENILTDPGSTITCIDIFDDKAIEDLFDQNIAATGFSSKVKKLKGSSEKMLRGLPLEHFDYVYIDACHMATCVLSDAILSWDLLKKGGLMIFDDYRHIEEKPKEFRPTTIRSIDKYLWKRKVRNTHSPKPAIDSFLEVYGPHLEVVFKKFQVVVRKK